MEITNAKSKNNRITDVKPGKSRKWLYRGIALVAVVAGIYFIRDCTRNDKDTQTEYIQSAPVHVPDTTDYNLAPGDSIGFVDDVSGNLYRVKVDSCPEVPTPKPKPKTSYKPQPKAPKAQPIVVKDSACEERLERIIEINEQIRRENDSLANLVGNDCNMYEAIGVDFGFAPDSCGVPLDDCGKPITEVNNYE